MRGWGVGCFIIRCCGIIEVTDMAAEAGGSSLLTWRGVGGYGVSWTAK